MKCSDFFDPTRDAPQRCKELQLQSEATQKIWELETASIHSPTPVANDETLARQVVDPTHFDNVTGTIKPTFFDDASSIGASCHRTKYASAQDIYELTSARIAASNLTPPKSGLKTAIGYATLIAAEVRAIASQTAPIRRGAAVYDTAKQEDISHADVCQLVSGRQDGKSVRAQLFMLAKNRLTRFAPLENFAD